ncbi:MAG: sugar phosphate isomerase/epimerase [Oscillospiraceae bacterium]|nr:sugar phosphate isomerase/epimerase [Oscillospiraceae bacterium]
MICYSGDWFGCEKVPFEERYRLIKQAGFDGVYAWWNEEGMDDYRAQPAIVRGTGLYLENIHAETGGSGDFWEDTPAGAEMFEYYLDLIGECAEFDIPAMIIHTGCGAGYLPPVSDVSITRLERMIDKAERLGVNIAVENQCDPEKILRAMEILERFDSPRLGMCYDSGHGNTDNSLGYGKEMLRRFGHRLMALHLHDNDGSRDQHRLPFDGSVDWPSLMRQIEELGYKGPTTLELGGAYPELTTEEFLREAFERAAKLDALRK